MSKVHLNEIATLLNITASTASHLDKVANKIKVDSIDDQRALVECFYDMLDDKENVEILTALLSIEDISSLFLFGYVDFIEVIDKLETYNLRGKFLVNLVMYFWKQTAQPEFWDYEKFIEFLFKAAKGYRDSDLSSLEIEEKFIFIVSLGMRFAGEQNEKGYAYNGGSKIRENARFLTKEVIEQILKANVFIDTYRASYLLRKKYIFELIDYSDISDEDKDFLKFRYIDIYVIGERLLRFLRRFIQEHYSEYHYIDEEDEKKDVKIILENAKGQRLFVKVQLIGICNYFFITSDANSDSPIFQFYVLYENNKITIEKKELGTEEQGFSFDFEYCDYSENLYFEYNDKIEMLFDTKLNNERFELIYVYAERLYDVPKRALLFSNEYQVEKQGDIFKLSNAEQSIKMPENFFGENISSVYAIVGKNGTGKSSIINLLMNSKIFVKNGNGQDGEYLIIYKMGKNLYWSSSNSRFEAVSQNNLLFKMESNENYYSLVNTKVALFSNVYDTQKKCDEGVLNNEKNRINLTTQKIAYEIDGMCNYDVYRILNYISKYQLNTNDAYDKWENRCVKSIVIKLNKWLPSDSIKKIEKLYDEIAETFSLEFNGNPEVSLLQKLVLIREKDDKSKAIESFNVLNKIFSLIQGHLFELKQENIGLVLQFLDLVYENSFLKRSIFVGFSNLSSGECAKLTLFSRILSLFYVGEDMPQAIKCENVGGNYVLIFDEAEVYLHPAWQRKILQHIISYVVTINDEFSVFDNLMIILSSNSPFYLSDLPKQNIFFFGNENEIKDENTFGQNIHMLMRNNFFMNEGLMGEFSVNKINQTIEKLNSLEWKESLAEAQYVCDIIGETIIKNSLQTKIDKLINNDNAEIIRRKKKQIEKLQAEIEELGGD